MEKCGCNNARCKHRPLVHCHLHSSYSLLDGCGHIDSYIKKAKEFNHSSITILDHGNMSGTFDFYKKCKASGIKPILGMEAYLSPNLGEKDENDKRHEGKDTHQSIIIKNKTGFVNLNKLTYLSFSEGYFRRGRISTEWLLENKEGLIVTTSCMGSLFARLLEEGKMAEAEERIKLFKREFGNDFYAELQFNEIKQQKVYNDFILRMVKKYDLQPVLAGDVHYSEREDARLQDVLIATNQRKSIDDPKAFKLEARHLYYSNFDDFHIMNKQFGYNYPEHYVDLCLDNTLKLSEKCNFDFETDVEKYPKYEPTKQVSEYFKTTDTKEIITKLAHAKLKQKLNKYKENGVVKVDADVEQKYRDRLDLELKVISDKNMLDYFMVIWELIKFCEDNSIETGPGRGSAAGSLLSYCLGIVKIDPIRFNLYFERFLNPSRKGAPDIDIDFEMGSDEKTLNFLYEKYGRERVIPVITFGKFNEKGCLKDVTKALGMDAGFGSDVFAVTKEMPDAPVWDISLKEWFETWPNQPECSDRVKSWITNPHNAEILSLTLKLQGQVRNIGRHAAGIVITDGPVWQSMPVNISKGQMVSGFQESGSGKDLSELGILKIDRLKLETLNVIKDTIKLVKEKKGINIQDQVDFVNLEDPKLFEELLLGNNQGVFQFESQGINALLKSIHVEKFDELVAANSLYRPGPMGIGAHDEYVKNKFHPNSREYVHPALIPLLEKTNGVLIYQEDLMFIAHKLAGMTLGEGDNLRKYMDAASKIISKKVSGEKLSEDEEKNKNYKNYKDLWVKFIEGCKKNGLSEEEVSKIEEWLVKYLGYSFNLSHATCYSYIAMQTLFLKHYYPTEFYASLLNHSKSNSDKDKEKQWMQSALLAAMAKGIELVTPNRKSNWEWTMIEDKKIAMGFSGINGMGAIAYDELKAKKFENMSKDDFFATTFRKFNKKSFESCLKAGLFDDWSASRDEVLEWRKRKITNINQLDIFGNVGVQSFTTHKKFNITPSEEKQKQFMEVCNLDLTLIRKLSDMKKQWNTLYGCEINPVTNFENPREFYYFFLAKMEEKFTKKGQKFFQMHLSDGGSVKKVNMWSNQYMKLREVLQENSVYVTKFTKDNGWLSFNATAEFRKIF